MARKLIALCGHPQHGKTTAQKILDAFFDVQPFDDGRLIREATIERYPFLTWDDVTTAEGKAKIVMIPGLGEFTVRQLLGNLGKEYEDGDEQYWGKVAIEAALAENTDRPASFGSVRRKQGHAYRNAGGLVLEIVNPAVPLSKNDFDQYCPHAITHRIMNAGSKEMLARSLIDAVELYLNG